MAFLRLYLDFLTKHSEVGLALGIPGSQSINLAEEFPLIGELDVLDGESSSLLS